MFVQGPVATVCSPSSMVAESMTDAPLLMEMLLGAALQLTAVEFIFLAKTSGNIALILPVLAWLPTLLKLYSLIHKMKQILAVSTYIYYLISLLYDMTL